MTYSIDRTLIKSLLGTCALVCWFLTGAVHASETPEAAMAACASDAGSRKGDERKAFMVACLSQRMPGSERSDRSPVAGQCGLAGTVKEKLACEAAEATSAEAALNRTYKSLRSKLQKNHEVEIERSLISAQRDWIKFRESHCAFEATYEGAGGSAVSEKLGQCTMFAAKERTAYLRSLLEYFP